MVIARGDVSVLEKRLFVIGRIALQLESKNHRAFIFWLDRFKVDACSSLQKQPMILHMLESACNTPHTGEDSRRQYTNRRVNCRTLVLYCRTRCCRSVGMRWMLPSIVDKPTSVLQLLIPASPIRYHSVCVLEMSVCVTCLCLWCCWKLLGP